MSLAAHQMAETNSRFRVLAAEEVRTASALGATFIPGNDVWPSGAVVDYEGHLDRLAALDGDLRASVQRALGRLDAVAEELTNHAAFADCVAEDRETVVKAVEAENPETIRCLVELAYEAYYAHPVVLKVIAAQTGYHFEHSLHGVTEPDSDQLLLMLAEVAERGPRVRTVPPVSSRGDADGL